MHRLPRDGGNSRFLANASKKATNEIWLAFYLLLRRLIRKYSIDIEYHCTPLGDANCNNSNMRVNFSIVYINEIGNKGYFEVIMSAFSELLPTTSLSTDRTTICA